LRPEEGRSSGFQSLRRRRGQAVTTNKRLADPYAANVLPVIREIERSGATSLHKIAEALNARGITTSAVVAKSVSNVLARA